jgi:hypothetical protein
MRHGGDQGNSGEQQERAAHDYPLFNCQAACLAARSGFSFIAAG